MREDYLRISSLREMDRRVSALGVGAAHVSIDRWETGDRMPPADYLAALIQLAGVNGHWLLTGEGDPLASPTDAQNALGEIRRTLAQIDADARALSEFAQDAADTAAESQRRAQGEQQATGE